jgi:hypothetical protein
LPLQIFPRGGFLFPRTAALRIKCTVLPCRLRVTVNFPVSLRAGEARQHATGKPRVITLARGAITVKTHRLHTVRLRLTAAGRRFVAFHTGRVTVTVAVAMTIRGHTHRTKQRLTLTIAKARTR